MSSDTSERRLAAILSADAVGYSRLMAEDEAATVRSVRAHHGAIAELVGRHGGRVVDSPGDNALAEFRSVVEAVRCALEIQRDTTERDAALPPERRMRFRIGVHLGDVIAEGERIYGDGVNVAARLEGLAQPGGVCISEAVHQQVRRKLDLDFEDLGDCEVKNLPDPVRAFRVRVEGAAEAPAEPAAPAPRSGSRLRRAAIAVALALVLAAGGLWLSWPAPLGLALDLAGLGGIPLNPGLPDEPSLVVLPFDELSDDPGHRFLAAGITEDVTAGLAGIPRILVISRNSAYTYEGQSVNVADIGRELGVRYVVEGSVRQVGDRVRVTVQLIDATRDVHVWSERYDRDLADVLDLQAEITQQILAAVDVEIQDAEFERLRREPTRNLSAYEASVRGSGHLRRITRDDIAAAGAAFERAIELDPGFAAAYAGLAMTHAAERLVRCPFDSGVVSRARALAARAQALDPFEPTAHLAGSAAEFIVAFDGRGSPAGLVAAERAVELIPNSDMAHAYLGGSLLVNGRMLEAIGAYRRALRLSPRPMTPMIGMLGHANYLAGRHEAGVALYERSRASNPDVLGSRIMLAGHYQAQGRDEQARTIAQEVLRESPACTAEHAASILPPRLRERWIGYLREAGFPDRRTIRSLAVLPLDNLSGDSQQDYFADGMTEALISDLAGIDALRVISRTSAMQYRGARKPLPEIARELGVDAIVEGSVLRSGDRVRITAQLVDAESDHHLWSESYERDMSDVLALQGEVARAIARAVEVEVSPAADAGSRARRVDPAAYEAYLRGRQWLGTGGRLGHHRAAEYFQQAVDVDPGWASAWAGLADANTCSCMWTTPAENMALSRAAAEKALLLDPRNAEGHTALGLVQLLYDWDWDSAETNLRRAVELAPNMIWPRWVLGFALSMTGRVEEALAELERTRAIDPLAARPFLARLYESRGELARADAEWERSLEAAPNGPSILRGAGVHHCAQGDPERGLPLLEKARMLDARDMITLADLAWCRAAAGDGESARALLAELDAIGKETYVDPASVALAHVALGDHDVALDLLERGVETRALFALVARVDPRFAPLQPDPRFAEILGRIELPLLAPTASAAAPDRSPMP